MKDVSNPDPDFYHLGMRKLQDQFDGRALADALERHHHHTTFTDQHRALILGSPFFFIATAFNDHVDCSMKSGAPGFVRITGPNTLEYAEYEGNSMYRTLGNLMENPCCGLLFARFEGEKTRLRIKGRARVSPQRDPKNRGVRAIVSITCDVFPNCASYIPNMTLGRLAEDLPDAQTGARQAPSWQMLAHLRDVLPKRL